MPVKKKHPAPAHVQPKVGLAKLSRAKRLDKGLQYVSGQVAADPQAKLAQQAAKITTTRTNLVGLLNTRATLEASLDSCQGGIVVADFQYAEALTEYATAAGQLSAGDASLLSNLGVDRAATRTKSATAVIDMPVLTLVAGANPGDLTFKCGRVARAGAYVFEYKNEPSLPTDPWTTIITKYASTAVPGLPPAQLVRARARAVGVTQGPWSVEVVGRAK